MENLYFNTFIFNLNGIPQQIGGGASPSINQLATNYPELVSAFNVGIQNTPFLKGKLIVSLGPQFTWPSSDEKSIPLNGYTIILSTMNQGDSLQIDGGGWSGIGGGSGSFATDVQCFQ
jgi:hypothetical protein